MSDQHLEINGLQQSRANGTTTASADVKTERREQDGGNAAGLGQLPPELAHITTNFQPLSRLLERSAQECYNDLDEAITTLAGIPSHVDEKELAHPENFKNIVVSSNDAQKRLRWLEFGKAQRERFVKLLVLTRWSRQVDDVGQVIDLFNWMNIQSNMFGEVDESMAQLRRWLDGEKVLAPDLETALEVLATGTSTKMPDLGFVKPEPLSATEILDTFRNVNTILHLRLNTVEDLPHHLRNFQIASGRVTFTIPNEFELDLSIADEDPASQFYFIDFRFLFSPSSEIPTGSIHDFEASANNALASEGLSGCYNLFHDFVLTHKINILRRQAINLNRTSWAGTLNIEQVHRSLIIQYWTGRPGPKSWIEIGIASNKSSKSSSSSYIPQRQSGLKLKWMRSGEEVKDLSISLDDVELNSRHILEIVLAEHSEYLLSSISESVPETCLYYDSLAAEVLQSKIAIPLFQDQLATLFIEPITGSFCISPVTRESLRCQNLLSMLPVPANVLKNQLPLMKLQCIASCALPFNWKMVIAPHPGHSPHSRKMWLPDVHSCAFRPGGSWGSSSNWNIGVTVDSSGAIEWSIAQEPRGGSLPSILPLMNWHELVLPAMHASSESFPFEALSQAGWLQIYLETVQAYLREHKVPHQLLSRTQPSSASNLSSIAIESASFLKDSTAAQCLYGNALTLFMSGSDGKKSDTVFLGGRLKGLTQHATEFSKLKSTPDSEWASDGRFVLAAPEAHNAFGPCTPAALDVLSTRVLWLCRIPEYLSILKRRGFKCISISMECISFSYRYQVGNQTLYETCTINNLSESDRTGQPRDLIVLSRPSHSLLMKPLHTLLRSSACGRDYQQGGHALQISTFNDITKILMWTIPLTVALSKLELKSSTENVSLHVSAQAWNLVLLQYYGKNDRECTLRICLTPHYHNSSTSPDAGKGMRCYVENVDTVDDYEGPRPELGLFDDLLQILARLLEQESPKVLKLKYGIEFAPEDVGEVLDNLDTVVKVAMLKEPDVVQQKQEPPADTIMPDLLMVNNPLQSQPSGSEPPSRKRQRSETSTLPPQAPPMARPPSTANNLHTQAQLMTRGPSNHNQSQNQALAHAQLMARGTSNQNQAQPMMTRPTQGQLPQPMRRPSNQAQAQSLAQAQMQSQAQFQAQSQAQFQAQSQAQFQAQAQQAQVRQAQLQAQAQAQMQAQARKLQPQKQPPLRPPQGQAFTQQAQAAAWQNMQGVNGAQNMMNGAARPGSSSQRPTGGPVEIVELD